MHSPNERRIRYIIWRLIAATCALSLSIYLWHGYAPQRWMFAGEKGDETEQHDEKISSRSGKHELKLQVRVRGKNIYMDVHKNVQSGAKHGVSKTDLHLLDLHKVVDRIVKLNRTTDIILTVSHNSTTESKRYVNPPRMLTEDTQVTSNSSYRPYTKFRISNGDVIYRPTLLSNQSSLHFTPVSQASKAHELEVFDVQLPPFLPRFRNPCWLEALPAAPHPPPAGDPHPPVAGERRREVPGEGRRGWFYVHRDCQGVNYTRQSAEWTARAYAGKRRRGHGWRLRCLPYFYVLGMTKCGTTDLYWWMGEYLPHFLSGARKEPQYWNRRRFGVPSTHCPDMAGYRAAFDDYLSLYDEFAEKIFKRDVNHVKFHPTFTGDFTPATLWMLPQQRHLPSVTESQSPHSDPPGKAADFTNHLDFTTPSYIHRIQPQAKFVVLVRDPVERAFSHYKFFSKYSGRLEDAFDAQVLRDAAALMLCRSRYTERDCVLNMTDPMVAGANILQPGFYVTYLSAWLAVFPRDQFLVLRFEDYIRDRAAALDRVTDFLGTEPVTASERQRLRQAAVYNRGSGGRMKPSTRRLLRQLYAPWNRRLSALLDHNPGYLWGYS